MGIFFRTLRIIKTKTQRNAKPIQAEVAVLNYDGLNPMLARQLSELEVQIGQLAQVQFELSQERSRMRFEMDALKKSLEPEALVSNAESSPPPESLIQD